MSGVGCERHKRCCDCSLCLDCSAEVFELAIGGRHRCVQCCEKKLGRFLVRSDFASVPCNTEDRLRSWRLRDRLFGLGPLAGVKPAQAGVSRRA
jgi:hypothetical protein